MLHSGLTYCYIHLLCHCFEFFLLLVPLPESTWWAWGKIFWGKSSSWS